MTMWGSSSVASRAALLLRGSLARSSLRKRSDRSASSSNILLTGVAMGSGAAGILAYCSVRTSSSSSSSPASSEEEEEVCIGTTQHWCSALVSTLMVIPKRPAVLRCDEKEADVEEEEEEEALLPLVENFDDSTDEDTGYTEAERFFQCLDYHRSLLYDYERRWGPIEALLSSDMNNKNGENSNTKQDAKSKNRHSEWPRRIPTEDEINALETDLTFCLRSTSADQSQQTNQCPDLQFRIATFYVTQDDRISQRKGFKQIKELAEQGHPDSMCYYGILLNEGNIAGVEANPQLAVVWWRRCVDYHRHIKATYELATANYLGEGTPENPALAVKLYRRAAHLGSAAAAYMLGECLLDGVGTDRDRENALEWLVTAAELGHVLARKRVFTILSEEYENLNAGKAHEQRLQEEAAKWINLQEEQRVKTVSIERRFSIGGGSRNPKVMARRQTKVKESRGEAL